MEKVLRYIYTGVLILIVALITALVVTLRGKKSLENKYKDAMENVKSYGDLYSKSEDSNRAFKLTVEQLKGSNDSIFRELDETRKELKVKDSKLKSLQYVSSDFSRVDTITLKGDTIFKEPTLSIDTLINDEWYSLRVALRYPSMIMVKPEFVSKKYIVVSAKKETVNPPKKFFLFRWFQKKHTVLDVEVVEKNPYMQSQNSRFVEIIR